MTIKFYTFEDKILNMRKSHNCFIPTILNEAIKWFPNLDEEIILCDVLRILQKHNLPVKKNEVKKAFFKYYKKSFHGESKGYLLWIYQEFNIGKQSVFSKGIKLKEPHTKDFSKKLINNMGERK